MQISSSNYDVSGAKSLLGEQIARLIEVGKLLKMTEFRVNQQKDSTSQCYNEISQILQLGYQLDKLRPEPTVQGRPRTILKPIPKP